MAELILNLKFSSNIKNLRKTHRYIQCSLWHELHHELRTESTSAHWDVLTRHTHRAELIQLSPVCSQRAQSATATEKRSVKNPNLWKQTHSQHETHSRLAGAARSYRRAVTHFWQSPTAALGHARASAGPAIRKRGLAKDPRHRPQNEAGARNAAPRPPPAAPGEGAGAAFHPGGRVVSWKGPAGPSRSKDRDPRGSPQSRSVPAGSREHRAGPSRRGSHLAALALLVVVTEADGRQAGQVESRTKRGQQQEAGRRQPHLPAWRGEGSMSRGDSSRVPGQRLSEAAPGEAAASQRRLGAAPAPWRVRRWAPSWVRAPRGARAPRWGCCAWWDGLVK